MKLRFMSMSITFWNSAYKQSRSRLRDFVQCLAKHQSHAALFREIKLVVLSQIACQVECLRRIMLSEKRCCPVRCPRVVLN